MLWFSVVADAEPISLPTNGVADRTEVLDILRDALSACDALHGLRLKVHSTGADYKARNMGWMVLAPGPDSPNIAPRDWLATVDILTSLPRPSQLRHFSCSFWSDRWTDDVNYAIGKMRDFPWVQLRETFTRLDGLSSVVVCFADYAPGVTLVDVAWEIVKEELKDFGVALREEGSSAFYVCEQKECRWRAGRYVAR